MNAYFSDTEMTWEAYLALEADSEERYEYHDGEVIAMAGATNRHNEIVVNTSHALRSGLMAKGCKVYTESVKLYRYQSERYLYPDLMVTCNPLDLQAKNGIRSPLLIAEVLSKTNTHKHLTFKMRAYFRLPSLQHYLLISQDECMVQHFRRTVEGNFEVLLYDEMDQAIDLPELDAHLRLADIYHGIEFDPEVTYAEEEAARYAATQESSS
jgi:Uma2 family endonuclease